MIRYSSTTAINRPPGAVYELLLDPQRYAEWTPMVDMQYDSDEEPRVGTRGRFRLEKGPMKGPLTYEITKLEPDRLIVWSISHPSAGWTAVARLEPSGSGTHLEYSGEIRLRGWRRLLEPLVAAEARASEGREVERLKELLETEPAPAPATA